MGTKPSYRHRLSIQVIARTVLFAGLIGVSPASHAGLFSDDAARAEIQQLKAKVASLTALVNQLQGQIRQESLDTLNQFNSLKSQLASLQNEADLNGHNIQHLDDQEKKVYSSLDARIARIEKQLAIPAASAGTPAVTASSTTVSSGTPAVAANATTTSASLPFATGAQASGPAAAAAASGASGTSPTLSDIQAYNAAFDLLKLGHFKKAIAAMSHFLSTYPDSPYAANAQYWIGNCQYALGEYSKAVHSERLMLAQYPDSSKVPDAMLNLADDLVELGNSHDARKVYDDLIRRFPSTAAADQAKAHLRVMN